MNRASPGILGPVRKNETNASGGGASDRCRPFVSVRVGPVGLPRRRAGRGRQAPVHAHRTGEVCFARNASEHALIASTTKIMTGLLIAEDCDPDAVVTVPQEAVGIEGSSLYLKAGEQLTVRALLYGLLLHSGNDAAVALALAHSGSVWAFVEAMNGRARELGLHTVLTKYQPAGQL